VSKEPNLIKHGLGKGFEELRDNLRSSNDRIAVIVNGAYFHDLLLGKIEDYLVDAPEVSQRLFHPTNGNLSTYATLVDLAFLLGLITSQARDWLKLVGRLRNNFAHMWGAESFTSVEASADKNIRVDIKKLREFTYPNIRGLTPISPETYTLRMHFDALAGGIILSLTDSELPERLKELNVNYVIEENESYHHAVLRTSFERDRAN
jgi:hypothetical protein